EPADHRVVRPRAQAPVARRRCAGRRRQRQHQCRLDPARPVPSARDRGGALGGPGAAPRVRRGAHRRRTSCPVPLNALTYKEIFMTASYPDLLAGLTEIVDEICGSDTAALVTTDATFDDALQID